MPIDILFYFKILINLWEYEITMNQKKKRISAAGLLITIGIVYGDIVTSPLYVMNSIVNGNGGIANVNR